MSFWEIDFLNTRTAWGLNGEFIYLTRDGCKSWKRVYDLREWLERIDFVNDTLGWGAVYIDSDLYDIYRSSDAGKTWDVRTRINFRPETIKAVSEKCVYVIGESIRKTRDGGTTWENVSIQDCETFLNACFLNPDTGCIMYNREYGPTKILRTCNGGNSWDSLCIERCIRITSLNYLDVNTGYFVIRNPSNEYGIYWTDDGFRHCQLRGKWINPVSACHFFNATEGIAIMGDSYSNRILKTTDGGFSWNLASECILPPGNEFHFYFEEGNSGILYRINNYLYFNWLLKTYDRGAHWENLSLDLPLQDVWFINDHKGFIAGGGHDIHCRFISGMVLQTDGSSDFLQPIPNFPVTMHSQKIVFTDELNGWIVGISDGIRIYHTDDGGSSWTQNNWDPEYNTEGCIGLDIFFTDENTGYLLTPNILYQTRDGAEHWKPAWGGERCETNEAYCGLNAICFSTDQTGWIVGHYGTILRTGDARNWEMVNSGTDLPLNQVYFFDTDHGWIAGGYNDYENEFRRILLKTRDGGQSWTQTSNLQYLIHDLCFSDSLTGYAVGEDRAGQGVILHTGDGGEHWTTEMDSLPGALRAIHFKDGHGWAVGDHGLFLTSLDPTFSDTEDFSFSEDPENRLQIIPNPFQTSVTIRYTLQNADNAVICIYDMAGRKRLTLVDRKDIPGIHTINWNPGGYEPGIYFCELRTGQYRVICKMVLLE